MLHGLRHYASDGVRAFNVGNVARPVMPISKSCLGFPRNVGRVFLEKLFGQALLLKGSSVTWRISTTEACNESTSSSTCQPSLTWFLPEMVAIILMFHVK